jgi:hypothetical protein
MRDEVDMVIEQILNTVAHEMCHGESRYRPLFLIRLISILLVACWIISNERKNPHGKVFKSWGRKVMRARPDITVTVGPFHGCRVHR